MKNVILTRIALVAGIVVASVDAVAAATNEPAGMLKHYAELYHSKLAEDYHRPLWHLGPIDGDWWDVNGLIYYKGRYHVMFIKNLYDENGRQLPNNWGHASSTDLIHWQFHPDALNAGMFDDGKGRPFWSGDAVENAPVPTIIPLVVKNGVNSGVWAAQPKDDELLKWEFIQQKPVLFQKGGSNSEYIVFDSTAWYDVGKQAYFLLCGNKNRRLGYEQGDSTSLFTSKDLRAWEYMGPLYKSRRDWTSVDEDTACPDFFPLGDKWVLLSHVHNPWTHCRYYIGSFDGTTFTPESMGRLNYLNDQMAAPETMPDAKGRRIFFGQIRTRSKEDLWGTNFSMPVILTLGKDKTMRLHPAEELKQLRYESRAERRIALNNQERRLEGIGGRSLEIRAKIRIGDAEKVGLKVACSLDGDEYTEIAYLPEDGVIEIDFSKSDLLKRTTYTRYHPRALAGKMVDENPPVGVQRIPFKLPKGEELDLHVFVDGCIIEVIVNNRAYTVQTIYPSKRESTGVCVFSRGGDARVTEIETHRLNTAMNL